MASRIEVIDFLIPAGTAVATPVNALLFDKRGTVSRLDIQVPPGPWGLVGFSIWHSSEQIIPKTRGQWIVTDDRVVSWPIDGFSDQPAWRIYGYNTDLYNHTLQVTTLIEEWAPSSYVAVPEETVA